MAPRWTPAQDRLLRKLYAQGTPSRLIGRRLDRSTDAVDARRRALAVPRRTPPSRPWSEGEEAFLRAATLAHVPLPEVARRLERGHHALRKRKERLALGTAPARRYDPAEDRRIALGLAGGLELVALASELGRSADALRMRAIALGILSRSQTRRRWTPDEDRTLRTGYGCGLSARRIRSERLPHRSETAIVARARRLGLATYARRWTPDEERRLASLIAALFPLDAIALTLHRSREAIVSRCRRLDLPLPSTTTRMTRARWSESDDRLLRRYPGHDTFMLARLTGRSEAAVRARQRQLELIRSPRSQHHAGRDQRDGILPGQQRQVSREAPLTPSRALALSRRLAIPLHDLQRLAAGAAQAR